ncbi:SPFH domain-containing protein [Actinomadura atramentaria]|uniref:SPFH domain-containing protein n=1 Tax=Actinomadura atramentaria TaxID=1990 RepID=UPI00036458D1|nr:SPFH domain-containing protein [Actinomadura atramentaria]
MVLPLVLTVVACPVLYLCWALRVVPDAAAEVVERLGRYHRTLDPGVRLVLVPLERVRSRVDLRERVVPFPARPIATAENLPVNVETVVHYEVTDARAATYGVVDLHSAMSEVLVGALRAAVGARELEQVAPSRAVIGDELLAVLTGEGARWGLTVRQVRVKAVDPPPAVREAIEREACAEHDKRADILRAEGRRQVAILEAEGARTAEVLRARGAAEAAGLPARPDADARPFMGEDRVPGEASPWPLPSGLFTDVLADRRNPEFAGESADTERRREGLGEHRNGLPDARRS